MLTASATLQNRYTQSHQKWILAPIWILRELLAMLLRMRPKVELVMSTVGALNETELVMFVPSARSSSLKRSVIGIRFNSDAFNSK